MRSRRAQDSLADGFEPYPLPPPGPDGALQMPSLQPDAPAPPRICEFGPCRNYHTFEIVMDAAQPMDGSAAEVHLERQHYCYPTAGVETDLGGTPVVSCNRYRPPLLAIGARRRFKAALVEWQRAELAAMDKLRDTATHAEAEAAADLAEAEAARAASPATPDPKPPIEGAP